ncbi:hypothetical protein [Gynuella sunshinyii]|uniref:Uncharacterized protein n=1 Tax=Gynuella sunshinyii YC6258 TaxID=1445510 RepID=A0A0C5VFI2_9GAMM|nr:hypothetical protein [Gynuella sunshinyii]AJQ93297.1 hypothetical Protein YC6258_01249 [Gynuella sunshinyii YC6258]
MKINIADAMAGMVLANDIISNNVRILKKGAELTDKVIQALLKRDILTVDVVDEGNSRQMHVELQRKIDQRFQRYENNSAMMELKNIVINAVEETYG